MAVALGAVREIEGRRRQKAAGKYPVKTQEGKQSENGAEMGEDLLMPVERLPFIICIAGEVKRYRMSRESTAKGKATCCNSQGGACVSALCLLCLAHAFLQ